MDAKIILAAFAVLFQYEMASAQQQTPIGYVPNPMAAAELWNPYALYYPFAIASAESYRDYYLRAQDATNKLYYQAYQSNAYPWITGYGTAVPYNLYSTTAASTTTQAGQTTAAASTTQAAQTTMAASTTQAAQTTANPTG